MKALDFLKEQQRRHKNMAESMNLVYFDDELEEAIAELEALQSRSCEGCKNLVETGKSFKHCDELAINISHMDWGSFCCNRYEAKDTQC